MEGKSNCAVFFRQNPERTDTWAILQLDSSASEALLFHWEKGAAVRNELSSAQRSEIRKWHHSLPLVKLHTGQAGLPVSTEWCWTNWQITRRLFSVWFFIGFETLGETNTYPNKKRKLKHTHTLCQHRHLKFLPEESAYWKVLISKLKITCVRRERLPQMTRIDDKHRRSED